MSTLRKTRLVRRSCSPAWNETFVYPNLQLGALRTRALELTAWSHNAAFENEFLGEVVLDLSDPTHLDERCRWHQLVDGSAASQQQAASEGKGGVTFAGRTMMGQGVKSAATNIFREKTETWPTIPSLLISNTTFFAVRSLG